MDKLILPACYLAPVSWFMTLIQHSDQAVLLECFEHFPKQTYRNRASIFGANGRLDLYLPVQKGKDKHTVMKDVRISYEQDWQRLHWMSIQTAYRSSAYFEYYEDDFAPFYEKKDVFLLDYNMRLTALILKLLKLNLTLKPSESYEANYAPGMDYRSRIHPKKPPVQLVQPYRQVFSDRFGFLPDLSIVDLLFNHGPQSIRYLQTE